VIEVSSVDDYDTVLIYPSDIAFEEYSNLAVEEQNTYTLTYTKSIDEATYLSLTEEEQSEYVSTYTKMVEEEVGADHEGAVEKVRTIYRKKVVTSETYNILDAHGQIQWEDTEETEKAYKIRYLTADGVQTDEANAVWTAAFVGCTYHCG
jgi:hypothetical protein